MTDTQQDQQAPSPDVYVDAPMIERTPRPVTQAGPKGASPFLRKYLGRGVLIRFGSGHVDRGRLVEIDQTGAWGRLDRAYDEHGVMRPADEQPTKRMQSINLRRAEVIQ